MFKIKKCRVEGCTAGPCIAGAPHHCVVCNNYDSTHSSRYCPLKINNNKGQENQAILMSVQTGIIRKCRVSGCIASPCMDGAPHHCRVCDNYDSTHSSKACPLLHQNMAFSLGSAIIGSPFMFQNNNCPKSNNSYYENYNSRQDNFPRYNNSVRYDENTRFRDSSRYNGNPRTNSFNSSNDESTYTLKDGPVQVMDNGNIYDSSGRLVSRLNL